MAGIVVVGSLNMDLVVAVERMPRPGETLRGGDLMTVPGGKGANQAAAVALLGRPVAMIGRVGGDGFGAQLVDNLTGFGVDTSAVTVDAGAVTGTAMILVNARGENCIVISPGANGRVSTQDIDRRRAVIRAAQLLLLQLEIPLDVVRHTVAVAHAEGVPAILNPAPAAELPAEIYPQIDLLVPNESEAGLLAGMEVRDLASAEVAARRLLARGVKAVIVTLGGNGALLVDARRSLHVPARAVEVVDTTAAGDAFIGGLAAAIAGGAELEAALRYAVCAGALAVTRKGAQTSLPTAAEVERLCALTDAAGAEARA